MSSPSFDPGVGDLCIATVIKVVTLVGTVLQ